MIDHLRRYLTRRSNLERLWRIWRTTRNWHEVLLVYLGLKRLSVAYLRSGDVFPVTKESWFEYWEHITAEYVRTELGVDILSKDTVSFEYLGRRLVLRFPKKVNFGALLGTFLYEDYASLNVSDKHVIDIGAYIGDTSIYFALKGARKVFAIEPYPFTFNLLVENIVVNSLEPVIKPINAAITDRDGVKYIPYIEEDTFGEPVYNHKLYEVTVNVPTYKLSTLIETLKQDIELNRLVLKLDCEGCEYDAILGSDIGTLKAFKEIILEFHSDPKPLINKLRESGFRVQVIMPGILYARQ